LAAHSTYDTRRATVWLVSLLSTHQKETFTNTIRTDAAHRDQTQIHKSWKWILVLYFWKLNNQFWIKMPYWAVTNYDDSDTNLS